MKLDAVDLDENILALLLAIISDKQMTVEQSFKLLEKKNPRDLLTDKDKEDMLKFQEEGVPVRDIAIWYGVRIQSAYKILCIERKRASQTAIRESSVN